MGDAHPVLLFGLRIFLFFAGTLPVKVEPDILRIPAFAIAHRFFPVKGYHMDTRCRVFFEVIFVASVALFACRPIDAFG